MLNEEGQRKKWTVTYFSYWHLSGKTEDNHENAQHNRSAGQTAFSILLCSEMQINLLSAARSFPNKEGRRNAGTNERRRVGSKGGKNHSVIGLCLS